MSATRLVTVSGPRGAGKETVLNAVCQEFSLHRIVPHTTRAPRPTEQHGREYFFVSIPEFERMLAAGEFVYNGRISETQRSGTHRSQFAISESGSVIDITADGARLMRRIVTEDMGGYVLALVVLAHLEERRIRIAQRDPGLTVQKVEQLLREDPVSQNVGDYSDFHHVIWNTGNDPGPACRRAIAEVSKFVLALA